MPQIHSVHWVSPAEYEAGEALATVRHEYVAGEVFAMTGASEQHNRISLNSAMQLRSPPKTAAENRQSAAAQSPVESPASSADKSAGYEWC